MSIAVSIVIRLLALFGVSLSPFAAGAAVAGLIAVGFAGWSGFMVHTGYAWAESDCDAERLRSANAQLESTLKEKDRQLAFVNAMQARDAARAAEAEGRLQKNQEAIDATPANSARGLARDAVGRVRDVR